MEWRALLARLRLALQPDPDAAMILDASERLASGINRRDFLRAALIGVAVAATVDVEQLLWTPGAKTIFLPELPDLATYGNTLVTPDWVLAEAVRILNQKLDLAHRIYQPRMYWDHEIGAPVRIRQPRRYS
jgi:hypothetical protein